MNDSYWYAELTRPVACPACGASMPADRSDDIAPYLWHLVQGGAPWAPPEGTAPDTRVELAGACSRCGGEVAYRAPGDVLIVAQSSAPSSAAAPSLDVRRVG